MPCTVNRRNFFLGGGGARATSTSVLLVLSTLLTLTALLVQAPLSLNATLPSLAPPPLAYLLVARPCMRRHDETDEWASSDCHMGRPRPPRCPATPATPLVRDPGIRTRAPGGVCHHRTPPQTSCAGKRSGFCPKPRFQSAFSTNNGSNKDNGEA